MKDSFVFYKSFYEAIKKLKKKDQLTVFLHMCEYAFENKTEEIDGVPAAIFDLIKPQIDANFRRFENGKKGGRPKTKTKPNPNLDVTKPEPNVNVNVNDNVNDNVNVNVNVNEKEEPSTQPQPTDHPTEVADYYRGYCILKGYQERENFVERFLSYRHGDWKADVRSWADQDAEMDRVKKPKTTFHNFGQRDPGDFDPYAMGLFANN